MKKKSSQLLCWLESRSTQWITQKLRDLVDLDWSVVSADDELQVNQEAQECLSAPWVILQWSVTPYLNSCSLQGLQVDSSSPPVQSRRPSHNQRSGMHVSSPGQWNSPGKHSPSLAVNTKFFLKFSFNFSSNWRGNICQFGTSLQLK